MQFNIAWHAYDSRRRANRIIFWFIRWHPRSGRALHECTTAPISQPIFSMTFGQSRALAHESGHRTNTNYIRIFVWHIQNYMCPMELLMLMRLSCPRIPVPSLDIAEILCKQWGRIYIYIYDNTAFLRWQMPCANENRCVAVSEWAGMCVFVVNPPCAWNSRTNA